MTGLFTLHKINAKRKEIRVTVKWKDASSFKIKLCVISNIFKHFVYEASYQLMILL